MPLPVVAKAPPEPSLPDFVPEPEPADMVPVPPMTAAEFDDGIGEHTLYFDEEPVPAPGDGILSRWDNPDYAAELAAAEAQMARADLPPPAPPAPVPEPPAVVAQPAPPPAPRTMRLTLEGETHFGFSKYDLTPSGRDQVDKLVGDLGTADYDVILITGHTDRIGTKAYNTKLSERRALNVKEYLTKNGVNAKRIQAKWVGAAEPVTTPGTCTGLDRAKTIQCLAPDRRVDVQVINAKPR
jgi:outer membrane protein OmpA-like peptidoglycan-associated protein